MTQRSQPYAVRVQPFIEGQAENEGEYMLTLCKLSAPVRVRTPDSEAMRQYSFFMSRSRAPDGTEQLRLHMGYFGSLADAQKWAHNLRARFPEASPERVPAKILQKRNADAPTIGAAPMTPSPPQADVPVMSDTQVLRVLETRRAAPVEPAQEEQVRGISLVGPEDTHERRALKDAGLQGASIAFAVQLFESAADINLANVPALSIFRQYTLYKTTVTREKRSCYCLRLGFFKDAISAKQVAYYVHSHFASVGVVPVTEAETKQAKSTPIDATKLSDDFQRSIDQALQAPAPAPARAPAPVSTSTTSKLRTLAPSSGKRSGKSLEETLDMLAASEIWNDPDSLSETGVRHLKLEVQKRKSPR
jgi:hypothetical protein